ncbi:hypothetical protein THA_319 [Thermosipho africanus TCF52B]|uniref:Uncharacterized protein n=2 Tax=Thermosipho TaxID=2420 RepID=B7IFF5_THEAB|nr:hypothetical protein [Thermosipho africanus]ACJ74819.1 hypothetical protein THA_319 [Thermosipho africanus TCF52B]
MKEIILKYLNNKFEEEEENKLYLLIKKIVTIIIGTHSNYKDTLIDIYGTYDSAVNEIINEIFIKIKNKKEILMSIINNIENIESYISRMILNHIIDIVKSYKSKLSLNKEDDDGNEKIDVINIAEFDDLKSEIIAEYFVEELKSLDNMQLCYYFYKVLYNEEIFYSEKSKDAKYKMVQRLKEKLRNLVEDFGIDQKEFAIAVKIYMSEICDKIRHNNREEKNKK